LSGDALAALDEKLSVSEKLVPYLTFPAAVSSERLLTLIEDRIGSYIGVFKDGGVVI
jgi:hypothetical protein